MDPAKATHQSYLPPFPPQDEAKARVAFEAAMANPAINKISRYNRGDIVALVLGLIALTVVIYLATQAQLFEEGYEAISWTATALLSLCALKGLQFIYKQYCISEGKKWLYVLFKLCAAKEYLHRVGGPYPYGFVRLEGTRPEMNASDLIGMSDYLNIVLFGAEARRLTPQLSIR